MDTKGQMFLSFILYTAFWKCNHLLQRTRGYLYMSCNDATMAMGRMNTFHIFECIGVSIK
jgi:hypothetical protein